jgi:two-component system LytT family sensor kinase
VQHHQDIHTMLDEVCARLAPALSARTVEWRETPASSAAQIDVVAANGTRTVVEIPVAEAPRYQMEVSGLVGGRRLLSDDHTAIETIAAVVGRRIDAIRLTHERYARELREQEIGKLATEAELRALRAQINPHFLFNALTTIGYLIQTAPPRALDTLMRLTALLRSVLRSVGEFTTLGREIELIESYLEIEHARFEQRLRVRIDVPKALRNLRVPTLLLQPIVENAIKHGISPLLRGGDVTVAARLETADGTRALVLLVHDTGAGVSQMELQTGRAIGVGLGNVERRLACQYGDAAALSIESAPEAGTTVRIHMPAEYRATMPLVSTRSAS